MRPLAVLAVGLFAGGVVAAPVPKGKGKAEEGLLGTWQFEAIDVGAGVPVPLGQSERGRFTFKAGGTLDVTAADGRESVMGYTLDPAATPKAVDLVSDGVSVPAVYELDGDRLRLCLASAGRGDDPRPAELAADGKRVVVITLTRVRDETKDK